VNDDRRLNVAIFWNSPNLSGAEKRLLSISRALREANVNSYIFLHENDAAAVETLTGCKIDNLVTYVFPRRANFLLRGSSRFPRSWKLLRLDKLREKINKIVFGYQLNLKLKALGIDVAHIAMSFNLPSIVSLPAIYDVTSPDWVDTLAKTPSIIPTKMALQPVSGSVEIKLRKALPHHTILPAASLFPNKDPSDFPEINIVDKERLIVFAHRLIPRKNGLLFARVARRFLDTFTGWKIAFYGIGPERQPIQEILDSHINNGHAIVDYTTDLASILVQSMVFVSIISPDNYPSQSVAEAMASANALLLADHGQTREMFFDHNGEIVDLDEGVLFDALVRMTSDIERLRQMGMRSRQLAASRFSQKKYIESLIQVYARILTSNMKRCHLD
jgi:glycosyltransferase involved in cell wall biosynthesis